ncbi:MAG: hypothetical protein US72_C0001G0091 [Microgenomates group bacterium GW2011_GWC1_38_12]|nr:MAG: hypothetical protein US72_C0001G0091 [Microgenomates group bacterium GW2011_GWC1_38_12]
MKILSIDTSCDETTAAVTEGTKVLSNVIWSQASMHAKFGGIYPSLAKRAHEERIDWVINKALVGIDAVAVTLGPGLAIALEVGIKAAKKLAKEYKKPLIAVNHVEGHVLSVLAEPKNLKTEKLKNKKLITSHQSLIFPVLSLIASGGTTQLILVEEIGKYKIIAQTSDDALGEALDKAARMLGLGYPGGAVLEKISKDGDPNFYPLPIPMIGQEDKLKFSYSGLKTAFYKLVEKEKPLTKEKIQNLAASYQNVAFQHVERMIKKVVEIYPVNEFWFGGGVSANIELRRRIRSICRKGGIALYLPYSKKLCTDNAAMIGVAAYFKFGRKRFLNPNDLDKVERVPRAKVDKRFPWE